MLSVQAERMECNGMNEAACGVMGGSKYVLPASRMFATYLEEGTSLPTSEGLAFVFGPKTMTTPQPILQRMRAKLTSNRWNLGCCNELSKAALKVKDPVCDAT